MSKISRILDIGEKDEDIILQFPSGKTLEIQLRPSNADVDYNGSLDIILPENQVVTCWWGDDMTPSPMLRESHTRWAKQLVMDLPE
jgi:hypothetical protein